MPATKKNPQSSPSHTKTKENDLETIKKLIVSKFSRIEERISSVEQQIKSQNLESLELRHANSAKLKDNVDRIDSSSIEVNQLKVQVSHLDEEIKKL